MLVGCHTFKPFVAIDRAGRLGLWGMVPCVIDLSDSLVDGVLWAPNLRVVRGLVPWVKGIPDVVRRAGCGNTLKHCFPL